MNTAVAVLTVVETGSTLICGLLTLRAVAVARGLRAQLAAARLQVSRDELTGLFNRAGLRAELARRVTGSERYAVLLVDLDGFKRVNDTYGHAVGDLVLVEVARRLSALMAAAGGTIARFGGDEFVLVAAGMDPAALLRLGYDVAGAVARPVEVPAGSVQVHASVGLVQGLPGDEAGTLLHWADLAMYNAKRARSTVAAFDRPHGVADADDPRPARWVWDRGAAQLAEVRP